MIRFACPRCHKGFQVDDKLAGRMTKCPNCNGVISIPVVSESVSASGIGQNSTRRVASASHAAPPMPSPERPAADAGRGTASSCGEAISRQRLPQYAEVEDKSAGLGTATKVAMGVCGTICAVVVGSFVWLSVTRDNWELENASRVLARLDEVHRLQQSNPLAAYKAYDEIVKEAQEHNITNDQFAEKLAEAEKARTVLYQKVKDQIRAEEAKKQRLAEEEARRAAAEKERVAQEEERNRAAEELQRTAEEKRRADKKRRSEAVSIYRNAPQAARSALNVLKKVEARTEVGIKYEDYSTVVGEAWADVKIFIESPDGKKLAEFSGLLIKIAKDYKLALDIWGNKVRWPTLYGDRADVETILQACWARAGKRIELAESLLDTEKTAKALETLATVTEGEEDFDAAWKRIEDKVLHR